MAMRVGRGINLGNALDGPAGQAPGLELTEPYVGLIAAAGFDTVRLTVRWPAWAAPDPPYAIDPGLLARVDAVLDDVLAHGLNLIVTMHFYDELMERPDGQTERFTGLWRLLAEHYRPHPADRLGFELLNEPRGALTAPRWNTLLRQGLAAIRAVSPDRTVLIGPVDQNAVSALPTLDLPDDDALIVAVHYYEPFGFTHQAVPWLSGAQAWLGSGWGGHADRQRVRHDLEFAARWAGDRGFALVVTEFGAYEAADLDARVRWTAAVRKELEFLGAGWCYWEFGTDFGAYDPGARAWREPLFAALLDRVTVHDHDQGGGDHDQVGGDHHQVGGDHARLHGAGGMTQGPLDVDADEDNHPLEGET